MYLAIDIGGTKTLIATLDDNGKILEKVKIPTPKQYGDFISQVQKVFEDLSPKNLIATGVGVPATIIDRENGVAIAFGNLSWENIPLQNDIGHITKTPVVIENDAKMA